MIYKLLPIIGKELKLNDFKMGNGIYKINENTGKISYYCYSNNIEEKDFLELKKGEKFIQKLNNKFYILQKITQLKLNI